MRHLSTEDLLLKAIAKYEGKFPEDWIPSDTSSKPPSALGVCLLEYKDEDPEANHTFMEGEIYPIGDGLANSDFWRQICTKKEFLERVNFLKLQKKIQELEEEK